MATPYRTEYITLGGLLLGSRALDCYDWSGLEGTAKRHPGNFVIPGTGGRIARDAVEDELDAVIKIRIDGRWDQDNARVAKASWRSNYYSLRSTLFGKLEDNSTQTVQLTRAGGTDSGSCIVVDPRGPTPERDSLGRPVPHIQIVRARLLLPDGALL